MSDKSTLEVPADASHAYWEDYAEVLAEKTGPNGRETLILITRRGGNDGRSDAQYIVDRMRSGLHVASILKLGGD